MVTQLVWVEEEVLSEGDQDVGQASKQRCGDAAAAVSAWALFPHFLIVVSSSSCFVHCIGFISFFPFGYLLLQMVKALKVIKIPMEGVQKYFMSWYFPKLPNTVQKEKKVLAIPCNSLHRLPASQFLWQRCVPPLNYCIAVQYILKVL